ncbi:hypothetical protein JCM10449v2_005616 [Rhodotorula kratochvilovae]
MVPHLRNSGVAFACFPPISPTLRAREALDNDVLMLDADDADAPQPRARAESSHAYDEARLAELERAEKRRQQHEKGRAGRVRVQQEKREGRLQRVAEMGKEAVVVARAYRDVIERSRGLGDDVDRLAAISEYSLAVGGRRPLDLSSSSSLGRVLRDPASATLVSGLCRLAEDGVRFDYNRAVGEGWIRRVTTADSELGWVSDEPEDEPEDASVDGEADEKRLRITGEVYLRMITQTVWQEPGPMEAEALLL